MLFGNLELIMNRELSMERPDIFLVRHGETTWNRIGRHQGQTESVLTLNGMHQVQGVGRRLAREIDDWGSVKIFCSPMYRCRQTAAVICDEIAVDTETITYDDRLKERSFGSWEGMTDEEIAARFPADWAARESDKWNYVIAGGGENYPALEARMGDWLDDQSLNTRIVLVTHGQAGRALRRRYLEISPEDALVLPEPQTAAFRLANGASQTLEGDF